MFRILTFAVLSFFTLFTGLTALAEDPVSDQRAGIIGRRLQDKNGEDLGRIVATVKNQQGAFNYIILMPEELQGSEDSLIPIPGDLINTGKEDDALFTSISREKLQNAPRVNPTDLNAMGSTEKQLEVNTYFTVDQRLRRPSPPRSLRIIPIQ
jgi:hypothetical protein